ncbi:hypothetical protein EVAR_94102_1 [Eumeta japonica]|uniref:Uncharacterized protein n=1 Tax=Eumeta variegata TaxID=151549 RepID=A0A4C1V728_EUMVA|nr:hypothetical protein EVAR_94102_1 [Eumeta japonica]
MPIRPTFGSDRWPFDTGPTLDCDFGAAADFDSAHAVDSSFDPGLDLDPSQSQICFSSPFDPDGIRDKLGPVFSKIIRGCRLAVAGEGLANNDLPGH